MPGESAVNSWLVSPSPNSQASLRLFCFPYAGGGVQMFHAWPESLPPSVEVCAIQLPGRGARLREAPFTELAPLVRAVALALLPILDKPFAFFGHSLGALVSFELARELRRLHGPMPRHLFMSGRGAPHMPEPDPRIHALPEPAFLRELRRLNGTPGEVLEHKELMQLLLPSLRADFAVSETYVYSSEPPLDCPVSAFGGLQDPGVSHDRLNEWRAQTCACFSLHMFPGDHFFTRTAQPRLLCTLSQELRRLESMSLRGLDQ